MRIRRSLWSDSFLLLAASCALGAAVGCAPVDEGASDFTSRRGDDSILNGQETADYPAVVMLMRGGQVFCTGTVIAPRKVLTAAHCASGQAIADQIGIGASDAAIEQSIAVAQSTPHPSYDDQTLAFDVAVLTLGEDAPVTPVTLNTSMDDSWVGRQVRLVGYGVDDGAAQTGSGTKRMVDIDIGEVSATHLLYTDTNGKSACNGDSGGPALLDDNGDLTVVAVASYVNVQGCTGGGGHYRVDALLDWIQTEAALDPNQQPDPNDPNQDPNDPNQDPNDPNQDPNDPNQDPNDPSGCNGETWEGRCDGNTVVFCDGGQVQSYDCNLCGFFPDEGYFDCYF